MGTSTGTKTQPSPDRVASYAAPALEKGLDVLELLAGIGVGATQKQIAEKLGRSVGEIYRMLLCLLERGYVRRQQPGETYHLTAKLFELANQHPPTEALIGAAMNVMRSLSHAIRQSCHLTVIADDRALVILKQDSPEPRGFSVRVGATFPLLETSSGMVLAAFMEPSRRSEIGLSIPSAMAERIEQIRRRGFIHNRSATVRGVIDLAYPILNHQGSAVASLVVPYLSERTGKHDLDAVHKQSEAAASQVSAAIGGAGNGPFVDQ